MKIVNVSESIQDDIELKKLMEEKVKVDAYAKQLQDAIRKIVYKYDTAKIDYSKKS